MTSPKDFIYKLPDDYTFKPETREKIDAFMEKAGITDNDLAQELVDIHVGLMEEYATALQSATLTTEYKKETE